MANSDPGQSNREIHVRRFIIAWLAGVPVAAIAAAVASMDPGAGGLIAAGFIGGAYVTWTSLWVMGLLKDASPHSGDSQSTASS